MSSNKSVSIIISKIKNLSLLKNTLRCLENQKITQKCYEIILCTGIEDDYIRDLKHLVDSLSISIIFIEENEGNSPCRKNNAIKRAKFDICVFLEEGVIVKSSFIEDIILSYQEQENIVFVGNLYGRSQSENHPFKRAIKNLLYNEYYDEIFKHPAINSFKDLKLSQFILCSKELNISMSFNWLLFNNSLLTIEKKVIKEFGLFDESFKSNTNIEDIELGYRLTNKGINIEISNVIIGFFLTNDYNSKININNMIDRNYFYNKHPVIEIELFCIPTYHYFLSIYRHFLIEISKLNKMDIDYKDILNVIPNDSKTLLVGCEILKINNQLNCQTYSIKLEDIDLLVGNNRIGFFSVENNMYNNLFVFDIWKIIPLDIVYFYLDEQLSISKNVYLVDTHEIRLKNCFLQTNKNYLTTEGYELRKYFSTDKTTIYKLFRI